MSNLNITDNKNVLGKTCSIVLTVIFFILSFLTGFNNLVIFVLGILLLGIAFLLNYKSIKEYNFYSLGIVLVPLVSYGIIMSLSYFSSSYYSISTRVFLTLNILLFIGSGYLFKKNEIFDFEFVFRGIFLSLSIICLINLIFTSVYFGAFYGLSIGSYYAYYNGASSRLVVANTAYALCGYEMKQVPIDYYLLYPFLLLTSVFLYLLGDRRNKFNIISNSIFVFIALISIVFVISKVSLIFVGIYLLFILLVSLLIIFKKYYNKAIRYSLYTLTGLAIAFGLLFFINSQYSLTGFRDLLSSNRLTNYVFNTNRYAENARIILNGVFSKEKLIGFPIYYDFEYLAFALPSNNVLVNQFMYGGIFAFIFFVIIIALFIYVFISIKKKPIEDRRYKYYPLLFVVSYFVITLVMDQNSFDLFDYSLILANYMSPFFYISLFIFGHYFALANEEAKQNEE